MTSFRHESGEKSFGHIAGDANEGRSIIKKKKAGPRGRLSLPDEDAPKAKGRRSLSEAAAKAKEKGKASTTSRLASSRKEAISSMVTRRPSARALARKAKGAAGKGASLATQDTEGDQGDDLSRQAQASAEQASRSALSRARKALGRDASATAKAPRGKARTGSRAAKRAAASREAIRRANVRAVRKKAAQKAAQSAATRGAAEAAAKTASSGVVAKVAAAIGAAISAVASAVAPVLAAILPVIIAVALVGALVSAIAGVFQQNKGIGSLTGNEAIIARKMKDKGFGDAQIAAVIANAIAESGANPEKVQDGGNAIGVWQFDGERKQLYLDWCSEKGYTWGSLDAQLEYMFDEEHWKDQWMDDAPLAHSGAYLGLQGVPEDMPRATDLEGFLSDPDVAHTTYFWMAQWERCNPYVSHYAVGPNRLENAQRIYAALKGGGGNGAAVTDVEWRQKVVDAAYSCIGWNYIYGVYSPETQTVDCSGLVTYCYSQVGVDIPHWSYAQRQYCTRSAADALPGDIVWTEGHVGIYVGNGNCIEGASPATGVALFEGNRNLSFVLAGSPLG